MNSTKNSDTLTKQVDRLRELILSMVKTIKTKDYQGAHHIAISAISQLKAMNLSIKQSPKDWSAESDTDTEELDNANDSTPDHGEDTDVSTTSG